MSLPDATRRRGFPLLTKGIAFAMIPFGLLLALAGAYLGSQVWTTGLGFALGAALAVTGAYMPYAGAILFVLLALFWLRVFFLERQKRAR